MQARPKHITHVDCMIDIIIMNFDHVIECRVLHVHNECFCQQGHTKYLVHLGSRSSCFERCSFQGFCR